MVRKIGPDSFHLCCCGELETCRGVLHTEEICGDTRVVSPQNVITPEKKCPGGQWFRLLPKESSLGLKEPLTVRLTSH
jgi:hypothetical protein